MGLKLEICIDSVASAKAAEEGGANRVELCDYLSGGGTTPSAGMISMVRKSINIDLHVLIRPRRGDFLYSDDEFNIMKKDIEMCRGLGADGVVIGALTKEGEIDKNRIFELIEHSGPLNITFHRAFDLAVDPIKALDDLLELKVHRLLTSGQQETALQGVELIRQLNKRAGGHMILMAGSGINEKNLMEIITRTGVREVHASVRSKVDGNMVFRKNYPAMSDSKKVSEFEHLIADVNKVRKLRKMLD